MSLKCNHCQLDLHKTPNTNKNHNIIRYACRADKQRYRHDGHADKWRYRHDGRAHKGRYRHNRRADSQCPESIPEKILKQRHFPWITIDLRRKINKPKKKMMKCQKSGVKKNNIIKSLKSQIQKEQREA